MVHQLVESRPADDGSFTRIAVFALAVLLPVRMLSAKSFIVQDCDEVYNYWEPCYYLAHGSGFQTWEYSPQYAIRSWTWIAIHAIPIKILATFFGINKISQFVMLRALLASLAAAVDALLTAAIAKSRSRRDALIFITFAAASPGIFFSAASFLPATAAMLCCTVALATWLAQPNNAHTIIVTAAAVAFIAWPFAAALFAPILMSLLLTNSVHDKVPKKFQDTHSYLATATANFRVNAGKLLLAARPALIIFILFLAFDSLFYRKFEIVPWHIIAYNVLRNNSLLYGTEPASFFIKNLALNFNVALPLCLVSLPLIVSLFVSSFRSELTFG